MSQLQNFTQALALLPWYKPTPENRELLRELDKDLLKWGAHVVSDSAHACVVAEALFDHVRYRFTLRVHAPVEIIPIDPVDLPMPLRVILKAHLRSRNVLKNFLPVVFDRLSAERQFSLVTMYGPGQDQTSHCIWVANVSGLGVSVVTVVEPETPQREALPLPEPVEQLLPIQMQQAQAALH